MSTNPEKHHRITPKPPKTAVIGAGGFLGRKLLKAYRVFYPEALGTSHRKAENGLCHLDLAAPDICPLRLVQSGYTAVVIAAGVTKMLQCEQNIAFTRARNVDGTLELARQISAAGLKIIWFSSDYVFDGQSGGYSDDAPTNPVNEYGRQKADVEKQLPMICGDNYLIIRLSKVFDLDPAHNTLLVEMGRKLLQGEPVFAAVDQIFCPTSIDDVIGAVFCLQRNNLCGLINVCAPTPWSRYDIAVQMAKALGQDPAQVKPISLDDLNEAFCRPKRTDLTCRRLGRETPVAFAGIDTDIHKLTTDKNLWGMKL